MTDASDRSVLLAQYLDYLKWGVVLFATMVGWFLSKDNVADWHNEEERGVVFLAIVTLIWSSWAAFLARLRSLIATTGADTIKVLKLTQVPWWFALCAIITAWFAVFDKIIAPEGDPACDPLPCSPKWVAFVVLAAMLATGGLFTVFRQKPAAQQADEDGR